MQINSDLRFALRQFKKQRVSSLIALLTLGIGIAASIVIFALVDAVLLRPLPYDHPERVYSVNTMIRGSHPSGDHFASWPDFFDIRSSDQKLSAISAYKTKNVTFGRAGQALRRISGTMLSSGMANVLGIPMQLGRDFTRTDELAGNRSVILTDKLWRSELNRDPHCLGRTVQMDNESYTVIGVLPAGFVFPGQDESQFWVTEATDAEGKNPLTLRRGEHTLQAIARLAPGVSAQSAAAELTRIQLSLNAQFPNTDAQNEGIALVPLAQSLTGDVKAPLRMLLAAVGLLLLIACVNVAGLMLTRSVARGGELAIRAALGAGRWALMRQLVYEALSLSLASGLVGLTLAALALAVAPHYLPASLSRASALSLDWRVLLFGLTVSLITGLLFGVYPAWRASEQEPATVLSGTRGGSTVGKARHRLHGALIVGETALSLLLLIGCGLLLRSFERVLHTDPGFQPQGVLTFRVAVPTAHFTPEHVARFSEQLRMQLRTLPGVTDATFGYPLPLVGGNMRTGFDIPGRPLPPGEASVARLSIVGPDYFSTMRIPLKKGRLFTGPEEQPTGPKAVLLNEAFVRQYFPGQDVLGKRIGSLYVSTSDERLEWQVVGVVGDVKRRDLTEAATPEYYISLAQNDIGAPIFAIRTSGDAASLEDTIRRAVAQLDPAVPVFDLLTYDGLVERSNALRRFQAILMTGFAILAVLLAAMGLYASLSHQVVERTTELGLRFALGAQRNQILGLVLRRGLTLAGGGLLVGVAAAPALTHLARGLLYETAPVDTITYVVAAAVLLAIATIASVLPAVRATSIEPTEALRSE